MDENRKAYEPPKVMLYRFDDNELILTASGGGSGGNDNTETSPVAAPDYAAKALNDLFGGINTTIEK